MLAVAVTGCARYTPLPLSTAAPLAPSLGALDASTPQAPLTVAQVITLALAHAGKLRKFGP